MNNDGPLPYPSYRVNHFSLKKNPDRKNIFFISSDSVKGVSFDSHLRISKHCAPMMFYVLHFLNDSPSCYLNVPIQQRKHYSKAWNLLKVNNKDNKMPSLTSIYVFFVNFEHSNNLL